MSPNSLYGVNPMDAASVAKTLPPLEAGFSYQVSTPEERLDARTVRDDLGYREGQENQAFSWLSGKGLIEETSRSVSVFYEITPLGSEYAEKGTPEERIFNLIGESGALRLPEVAEKLGLEQKSIGSAFGLLSKEAVLFMDEGKRAALKPGAALPLRVARLRAVLDKRRPSRTRKRKDRSMRKTLCHPVGREETRRRRRSL